MNAFTEKEIELIRLLDSSYRQKMRQELIEMFHSTKELEKLEILASILGKLDILSGDEFDDLIIRILTKDVS